MSVSWQQWEQELLTREREWEQKKKQWRFIPNACDPEPEVSVWWNILGTAIIVAGAAMVAVAFWALFQ
jgi:hypothetical protein